MRRNLIVIGISSFVLSLLSAQSGRHRHVGVIQRNMVDSYPFAGAILTCEKCPIKSGDPVVFNLTIENRNDGEWSFRVPIVFEAQDSHGKLAPETEIGCERHWFSQCFAPLFKISDTKSQPGNWTMPARAKWGDLIDLTAEYRFDPAETYSIFAYICDANGRDVCFKSNVLKIAFQ
jgi:hypothetical protein